MLEASTPQFIAEYDTRPNRLSDEAIREIQSLGYACMPFLQVEEAGPSIGLEKFAQANIHELSGGMKQRVTLAPGHSSISRLAPRTYS